MSLCPSTNCELLLVVNTGTTIQNFEFYDCNSNFQSLSISPDLDYYINYCSISTYTGNSFNIINLGQVEYVLTALGCCNNDKMYIGVPDNFDDFQIQDTIYSNSYTSTINPEIKNGCYQIFEKFDYSLLPILDINYYYTVIESPLIYTSQDCDFCLTDNPCDNPYPKPTPSHEIYNPSIQPRNECDVITLFPMSAQCFSVEPSNNESYDGSVGVGITGGTPPYKIEWKNGNKSSAISNLGYGNYPVKITDFYGDFVVELVCSLGANFTPTPTPTQTPSPTPSPTPGETPTSTPTPTPTKPKAWFIYSKCGNLYEPPTVIVQAVPGPYMSTSTYFINNGSCYVFLNVSPQIPNFPPNYNVVISQTNYFINNQSNQSNSLIRTFKNCTECENSIEPAPKICTPFTLFNETKVQQTYSYVDCKTNITISGQPILPFQLINLCSFNAPVVSNSNVVINQLNGTCP